MLIMNWIDEIVLMIVVVEVIMTESSKKPLPLIQDLPPLKQKFDHPL